MDTGFKRVAVGFNIQLPLILDFYSHSKIKTAPDSRYDTRPWILTGPQGEIPLVGQVIATQFDVEFLDAHGRGPVQDRIRRDYSGHGIGRGCLRVACITICLCRTADQKCSGEFADSNIGSKTVDAGGG